MFSRGVPGLSTPLRQDDTGFTAIGAGSAKRKFAFTVAGVAALALCGVCALNAVWPSDMEAPVALLSTALPAESSLILADEEGLAAPPPARAVSTTVNELGETVYQLQSVAKGSTKSARLPGIGYLANGYNIFRGDPVGDRRDPGFSAREVLRLAYDQGTVTADGRWAAPDHVTVREREECALSLSSQVISSEQSLTESLSVDVSVGGGGGAGGFEAKFKASTSYKQKSQEITTQSRVYISSLARCFVYEAALYANSLPELSPDFLAGIEKLKGASDEGYYAFIDSFGTHYVTEMGMGAKYGYYSVLSSSSVDRLTAQGVDVGLAASASFGGFSAESSVSTSVSTEAQQKYKSEDKEIKSISIGSKPSAGGDQAAWAAQSFARPVPISYSIDRLDNLVQSKLGSKYPDVVARLRAALDGGYCQWLVRRGDLASCAAASPIERPGDGNKPVENLAVKYNSQIKFTQSSLGARWGEAGRAADGRKGASCSWKGDNSNSLTHTQWEQYSWWRAELPNSSLIKSLKLYNRQDCCKDRMDNIVIFIGDYYDHLMNKMCETVPRRVYNQDEVEIECNLRGKFITVQSWTPVGWLTLCEVEIFGKKGW